MPINLTSLKTVIKTAQLSLNSEEFRIKVCVVLNKQSASTVKNTCSSGKQTKSFEISKLHRETCCFA